VGHYIVIEPEIPLGHPDPFLDRKCFDETVEFANSIAATLDWVPSTCGRDDYETFVEISPKLVIFLWKMVT
jgi:hypothetical protein